MKDSKVTKLLIRVTLLLVLAASISGLAPALFTSAQASSPGYSINDVSGTYISHGDGYYLGSGSSHFIPFSFVGPVTFTPATGTFHGDLITRSAGENSEHVQDGTYTVDANGHGTMTWADGAQHNDFYIVNGGAELKAINTAPPGGAQIASTITTLTKQ